MTIKAILIGAFTVFCIVIALTIQRGCIGETKSNPETITIHDTVRIKPETLSVVATKFVTRTINGIEMQYDTTILKQIDTLFVKEGVREVTACADTVVQDTFHICYNYRARTVDVRIGFVPRVKDSTIIFPPRSVPFLKGAPFVIADIDLNSNIFCGVGYSLMFANHLDISGMVGLNRSPFQATAHIEGRYSF